MSDNVTWKMAAKISYPNITVCYTNYFSNKKLEGEPQIKYSTLLQGCAVQPGLFPRIKVSHINVGVQPAFLTDSLARLFTRYSPCFCTEQAGSPGAAPGVGAGYGGKIGSE
jgi:hypothetical protein